MKILASRAAAAAGGTTAVGQKRVKIDHGGPEGFLLKVGLTVRIRPATSGESGNPRFLKKATTPRFGAPRARAADRLSLQEL